MASPLHRSGLRYLLVGGGCAAIHNLIMIAGAALGLHYLASVTASFLLLAPLSYRLHTSFTFAESPSAASFLRYSLAMLTNYPLTVALLFVFCDLFGAPMAVASPAATVVLVAWNYGASRWAIIRRLVPTP